MLTVEDLPKVIDPDDPARRRPPAEMAHLVLYLTPEEVSAVEQLAARRGLSVGELGLRSLAYGLTVMAASRREQQRTSPAREGQPMPEEGNPASRSDTSGSRIRRPRASTGQDRASRKRRAVRSAGFLPPGQRPIMRPWIRALGWSALGIVIGAFASLELGQALAAATNDAAIEAAKIVALIPIAASGLILGLAPRSWIWSESAPRRPH